MKTRLVLLLALVISSMSQWLCNAQVTTNGSGLTWKFEGTVPWGITYKFDVQMGAKDRWDSRTQELPPVSPGKALRLAREFTNKIPLEQGFTRWSVNDVRLLRSGPDDHEEWVYVVQFYAMMPGGLRGGEADLTVPVRLDGTVPKPTIVRKKL